MNPKTSNPGRFGAAQWISPDEIDDTAPDRGAYVLRTNFELPHQATSAHLAATALGVYEVFINGMRVGDIELAPGSTNYDETLYFQEYDVTHLLQVGTNRIEIIVSDGWFRGRNGGRQRRNVWGSNTAALAELNVRWANGGATVATDATWTTHRNQIVRADLMTGQTTDLRIDPDVVDPSPVRTGIVAAPVPTKSPSPPVRRVEERKPKSLTPLRPGVWILDAGQNLSGWLRVRNLGAPGTETVLEFGEHLDAAGDLTTSHLDMSSEGGERLAFHQIDRVIAGGSTDVFEPRHTVHGFQYVRITRLVGQVSIDDFTTVVVHSDLERRGWFTCSDPELERLHEAIVWSFRSNIVDIPTDCPTRERAGWTGDYHSFIPVATMLYNVLGFSRKWLRAVRDDQCDNGLPAASSPDAQRIKLHPDDPTRGIGASAGWGDATVLVPWALYETYGDQSVLEESWASMHAWVEYALGLARDLRHPDRVSRSAIPAPHEQFIWDQPFHYGEWLEPKQRRPDGTLIDPMAESPFAYMSLDRGEVGTAYLYRSTLTLGRAAELLERPIDAAHYRRAAARIRQAWQREFLRPDGHTVDDTQGAYVRALSFHLVPEALRDAAARRLVELVEAASDRLTTGFLSSGMLLPILADTGHADVAYRLLQRHGTPSWLVMLDRGSTTVWEDWDGIDEHGIAHESLNHYSKGAVAQFMHGYIAGLRQAPGSRGWKRFEVRPFPGGGITNAAFRFETEDGTIDVAWRIASTIFELELTVPESTAARVTLPNGDEMKALPGTHRYECDWSER